MPLVSGPVGTLIVATAAIAALIVWLFRRPRHPGPRLVGDDGIDRDELEAAEREVRDLAGDQQPEGGFEGEDWGPGAARPRPPMRL
ncbi:MAG TPA: hypothetical protein VMY76_10765 [Gemmatimonadales bacterium]|nr:hypothetical protein [Gemmatimonadales bacterium]